MAEEDYPYMGPRPGVPDPKTGEAMAKVVREINQEDQKDARRQPESPPFSPPILGARITSVPESDNWGLKKRVPPKGSTG
jgi:hypothetical protein